MDHISTIKDVLVAIAAIITSIVAVIGIRSWKHELRGKADFNAAIGLIKSLYKVRDEFRASRSPWVSPSEYPETYNPASRNSSKDEANAWAFIYNNRWKPVRKAYLEFEAQVLEAEALWGNDEEIRVKADLVWSCLGDLRNAMECMIDNKLSEGEDFQNDKNYADSVKEDLWEKKEDNQLSRRMSLAIESIEVIVRKHIRRS